MLKRLISLAITAAICLSFCVFDASAATLEWNGKTKLKSGNTYTISKTVTISNDLLIPKGVTIAVRDGGKLIFKGDDLDVLIEGSLSIAIGGSLDLKKGRIYIQTGGALNIYGKFLQYVDTTIDVQGYFNAYNASESIVSSTITIYKRGSALIKGSFITTKSSNLTISGDVVVFRNATLQIEGAAQVSKSGGIVNDGTLHLTKNAVMLNSGLITLSGGSSYNNNGSMTTTKSGIISDRRGQKPNKKMSADILVSEPTVEKRGIDVSYAQKSINWQKVAKTGIDFAIIRAARGVAGSKDMKVDDYFLENIKGAQENGLDVGVYFYSYAETVSQARKEATFLVNTLKGHKITYPVVLDVEEKVDHLSVAQVTEIIEAFFEVLMQNNYYPMLYSYKNWLETNVEMRILDTYAVWVAHLAKKTTYEGAYYMWQYSHTGKVSGIKGNVDLNIAYRDFPKILKKHRLNNL